jgi:2-keto-3-deoxy-6-phosphogluconate aldolase
MNKMDKLRQKIAEKSMVKIIAGIDNFDTENVKKVVCAADMAGADAIDISARPEIISLAKELTDLVVFVSSINPEELAEAVRMGADAVEIGNYDALYKKGLRVNVQDVLNITKRTRDLIGNDIFLCVTVPGHLEIAEQIEVAQQLEAMGVDMIQSEGASVANVENTGARGLLEKANVSIANTIELTRNVEVPVMTASGITPTTAPMAFAAGASAVGVGSCINKLSSTIEMAATARAIVEAGRRAERREEALV